MNSHHLHRFVIIILYTLLLYNAKQSHLANKIIIKSAVNSLRNSPYISYVVSAWVELVPPSETKKKWLFPRLHWAISLRFVDPVLHPNYPHQGTHNTEWTFNKPQHWANLLFYWFIPRCVIINLQKTRLEFSTRVISYLKLSYLNKIYLKLVIIP